MTRSKSYRRQRIGKISPRLRSRKVKRVTFYATKRVTKKRPVSFDTKRGKRVSFSAWKTTPIRVKVSFYSRKNKAT